MRFFSILFCLCLVLLLNSCRRSSPFHDYPSSVGIILKTDTGIFRGTNWNMSPEIVKRTEEGLAPMEEDSAYLYYEIRVDSIVTTALTYDFEAGKLREIRCDVFVSENAVVYEQLLDGFVRYYTDMLGAPESDGGFRLWTMSQAGQKIRIALTENENSSEINKSLSLTIYADI